jgi:hypothetical protein
MSQVVRADGRHLPGARLLDDNGRNEVHHSLLRADTVLADVEGLLHGTPTIGAPAWPLIAALRQDWGAGKPLVWLADLPITERPTLEKARLAGTTVRVQASHGSPRTVGAWTDVSRQAAAHTPALTAIVDSLAQAVAGDTDRLVAQSLAALGTITGGAGAALASVAAWPGPRLIVLAPNAMSELRDWAAYAQASGGAIILVADPYIVENLIIATAGVALGVLGPDRLTADQPSHLGIDVADMVTFALEVAPGAVATWESTGGSGSGGSSPKPSPTLTSITPDTTPAGSAALLTVLVGTNFDVTMSARVTRAPNPPLYVPATYNTAGEATMVMPQSEMLAPGVLQVHVVVPSGTPNPESNTVPFVVTAPPTPVLTNITPDQAGTGAIDKTVWLEGTGFTASMQALSAYGAEVALVHPTVFISPTSALFTLPASQMDLDGTVQISVRVPYAPADSNALPFLVVPPLPPATLTDITPDYALAGTTGQIVVMTGTNFADPMSARLTNALGVLRDAPATVVSATEANFVMPDDLVDQVREGVDVQAYVWDAVPALSVERLPFRAHSAPPTLTSLTPNVVNESSGDTTITMRGTGFLAPTYAVCSRAGVPEGSYTAKVISPTEATFVVPAASFAVAGVLDVFARVSDAIPSDTTSLPLTISGAPILTDITPDQMYVQDAAATLIATGSNFTPDCVLYVTNTPMSGSTVNSLTEMQGLVDMPQGTVQISVRDGQGNSSQQLPLLTIPRTPTITNITPDQVYFEDAPQRLTIDGTNFLAGMHMYDNGVDKGAVTIVSAAQCYINTDPSPVGNHDIKVGWHGAISGNGANIYSNGVPLSCINRPLPKPGTTITSVEPTAANIAFGPQRVNVYGSGFLGGGACSVNITDFPSGPYTVDIPCDIIHDDGHMSFLFPPPPGEPPDTYQILAKVVGNNPEMSPTGVTFDWL